MVVDRRAENDIDRHYRMLPFCYNIMCIVNAYMGACRFFKQNTFIFQKNKLV